MPYSDDEPLQLVPHSGVQFITRFLNLAEASRFRRAFVERSEATAEADRRRVYLLQDWDPEDPSRQGDTLQPLANDDSYAIRPENALEPYLGKWVPVPYLRVRDGRTPGGGEAYDNGPTNWVRVRVIPEISTAPDREYTHRVIFAVDTEIRRPDPKDASAAGPYTAPLAKDVEGPRIFRLVSDMARMSWFVQGNRDAVLAQKLDDPQLWVDKWLEELFIEFKRASTEATATRRNPRLQHVHEHAARWYTFIDLLAEFASPPRLSFIDTISDRVNESDPATRMVDVDFVLDVGNSRCCGIVVERFPNQKTIDLNNCRPLRIRDLSRPELFYTEPFESHVELSAANFGSESISRMSGRSTAFLWPSIVRVGPEAARVRAEGAAGRETGGMSSPKRYLWDMDAMQQEWRFPAHSYFEEGVGPLVERRIRRWVNQNGDVLSKVRSDPKIFRSLYGRKNIDDIEKTGPRLSFSRSSFYTFMLLEVIWQAWVMINDPELRAKRGEKGLPRRLRRIILTLPTATPVREQRIMRARAESALSLLWDMMDWSKSQPVGVTPPQVEVRWDEATCVQLVWLYGEIARKFAGNVDAFIKLIGRPRPSAANPAAQPAPSLRVASIDIGGGTTDLMIITYTAIGDRGLQPRQDFREGVRIAGDDILKLVAERIVLPAIQHELVNCGLDLTRARTIVKGCFDEYLSAEERHSRWKLTLEAIVPAALGLIHEYEKAAPGMYNRIETRSLGELVQEEGSAENLAEVSRYIEERAASAGAKDFSLARTEIPVDHTAIRDAVRDSLSDVFDVLGEALDHFDVDLLILSGRPARMPAIAEMLADRFPVSPNKIVAMHDYRPGTWFPFGATESGRISDPKTAVVVGALLCTYAQDSLEDFFYKSDEIQMRSTARYLGFLSQEGKMSKENVLFEPPPPMEADEECEHYGPRAIGSRQLPFERWVTAPLYLLSVDTRNGQAILPAKITLTRTLDEVDPDDNFAKKLESEASKEQIAVVQAEDRQARNIMSKVTLSFRTIDSEAHWLDTGILTPP
jgi:hypothetical protein